jgi:hypothetical protein
MANVRELIKYLFQKLDSLSQADISFDSSLQDEIGDLANSTLPEQEVGRIYHHLERIIGNLFRQGMLLMVCSCLEEAMDLIGETWISDYNTRFNKQIKGSWFKKRRTLFEEAGVSFTAVEEDCARIDDLLEVRNCIVHAGGKTEKYRYKARLEEAVARLKKRDEKENLNSVEITPDGFLYLGGNVVATAILASEEIVEQCLESIKDKAAQ